MNQWEKFLCEAYGCEPCSVKLKILTQLQIVRIMFPQQSENLKIFEEVEVNEIDHNGKLTKKKMRNAKIIHEYLF